MRDSHIGVPNRNMRDRTAIKKASRVRQELQNDASIARFSVRQPRTSFGKKDPKGRSSKGWLHALSLFQSFSSPTADLREEYDDSPDGNEARLLDNEYVPHASLEHPAAQPPLSCKLRGHLLLLVVRRQQAVQPSVRTVARPAVRRGQLCR